MGLIKAAVGAVGGVMADQWLEFFYCEAIPVDILVTKGEKRAGNRSSNKKGSDNVISNGSGIVVADGQCMIIVDQGMIVEVCAEPGQFTYDSSSEPSLFYGNLGENIINTFKSMGKRFTMGGEAPKDQRVYYFNTKEILDNKYGTPNPVPFRIVDTNIGLDIDSAIKCNGVYSYRITDPILFYTNVCGNIADSYDRSALDPQLKAELLTALQPAFAKISALGIRYSALPGHTQELADALNEILSEKWRKSRGIEIASFGVNSVTAPEEDEALIKELQKNAVMRDPTMAAATLVSAQSDAMRAAGANEGGAMMGFMGLGMAGQAGGAMNAQGLFEMGQQQAAAQAAQPTQAAAAGGAAPAPAADAWKCPKCGKDENVSKFCSECGEAKPADDSWSCECGTVNKSKFCAECGKPKPEAIAAYKCNKCGWEPEDPTNPPKFCPECGDTFDESDKK